jgi:elongator complex protein 4
MMKSSFVRKVVPKKDGAVNLPNATKPSIHNGQLLISTGLHELDGIRRKIWGTNYHEEILGGGVAVGTVVLVEEDENSSYYSALLKYYVSEVLQMFVW